MAKYMKCNRDFWDPMTAEIHVRHTCFWHHDEKNAEFHVQMGTLEYAPEPKDEDDPMADIPAKKSGKK